MIDNYLIRRNGRWFDPRTTSEVEETRDYSNRKPYRTKTQKEIARLTVRKVRGTFVSGAAVSFHA